MKNLLISKDNIEQEIVDNLQLSTLNRRRAEEKLFIKYSYLVKVGIWKYSLNGVDAFDAYSDAILAVIHSITNGTFECKCSLKTYLTRLFYYKCIDVIRKNAAQKNSIHQVASINVAELQLSDDSISVIEDIIIKSDFARLQQKLDQLSVKSRRILLLFAEGYNDKEIAELLSYKSVDVVKTTRLRCFKKLHELLQHEIDTNLSSWNN